MPLAPSDKHAKEAPFRGRPRGGAQQSTPGHIYLGELKLEEPIEPRHSCKQPRSPGGTQENETAVPEKTTVGSPGFQSRAVSGVADAIFRDTLSRESPGYLKPTYAKLMHFIEEVERLGVERDFHAAGKPAATRQRNEMIVAGTIS